MLTPLYVIAEAYPEARGMNFGENLLGKKWFDAHKFEPPVKVDTSTPPGNKKKKKQANQNFTEYMDMQHIQQKRGLFKDDDVVIATEKMHGTSFRAGNLEKEITIFMRIIAFVFGLFGRKLQVIYEFCYGSRRVQRQNMLVDGSVYRYVVDKYKLKDIIPKGMEIFGEIIGPGVQAGYTYGINQGDYELLIYDIKKDGKYVDEDIMYNFCTDHQLKMVPFIKKDYWKDIKYNNLNEGRSLFDNKTKVREGCVYCSFPDRIGVMGRCKSKHLNPKYLLNKDNTDNH